MATAKKKTARKAAAKKAPRPTATPRAAGTEVNPAMLRWLKTAGADGTLSTRSRSDTMRRCIDAGMVIKDNEAKNWKLTPSGSACRAFFDHVEALLRDAKFPLPRALARLLPPGG
jgi:hypothetical protein